MENITVDSKGVVIGCPQCSQRNRLPYENLGSISRCGSCKKELPSPDSPIDIVLGSHFQEALRKSSIPVLVDFWAEWCGPCKMLAPELYKVAQKAQGQLIVLKVNTENHPDLAREHGIHSIPALHLFSQGQEISRMAGYRPSTEILAWVEQVGAVAAPGQVGREQRA